MRARVERAVHVEQLAVAERHFREGVASSLSSLVAAIQAVPQAWAAAPHMFDEEERCDDIAYWTKPELPRVVSSLCELERLVKARVAVVSVRGSAEDLEEASVEARTTALYATLVGYLVVELVAPVMSAYSSLLASSTEDSVGKESRTNVYVRLPDRATSLFSSHNALLLLPVGVYIGWRCCFRLLDTFKRLLSLSESEAFAGWLDVAAALLSSLCSASGAFAMSLATMKLDDETQTVDVFCRQADNCARIAHCYWWWWSFAHDVGSTYGLTATDQGVSPSSTFPSSSPPSLSISSGMKDEFTQLWCIGRTSASRFVSAVALPCAVHVLQSSMTALVFPTNSSATTTNSSGVNGHSDAAFTTTRMQRIVDAVQEVRRMAADVFPHTDAFDIDSSTRAAAVGFMRLVVHNALLPLAERILDDPVSLQARQPIPAAAAETTAGAARDGWANSDDDDDDDEWEEVRVMGGSANTPVTPNMSAHQLDAEQPSVSCSHSASHSLMPLRPVVASVHDAVEFVLDTLEAQCGPEMVQQDAIAMTLRRLL